MQILEDNIEDFGDVVKRIQALRERVEELLTAKAENVSTVVSSAANEELVLEIAMLKKQLAEAKEQSVINNDTVEAPTAAADNDDIIQENILLKKQIADREKTIKELDFKLEMFKLGKTLREGAGISSKSEELKQMITEYIKEIDKSITSLNIE